MEMKWDLIGHLKPKIESKVETRRQPKTSRVDSVDEFKSDIVDQQVDARRQPDRTGRFNFDGAVTRPSGRRCLATRKPPAPPNLIEAAESTPMEINPHTRRGIKQLHRVTYAAI